MNASIAFTPTLKLDDSMVRGYFKSYHTLDAEVLRAAYISTRATVGLLRVLSIVFATVYCFQVVISLVAAFGMSAVTTSVRTTRGVRWESLAVLPMVFILGLSLALATLFIVIAIRLGGNMQALDRGYRAFIYQSSAR